MSFARAYPEYSSPNNVHLIKLVVSEFYRQRNLSPPSEYDTSVVMMDQCISLLIPLLITFDDFEVKQSSDSQAILSIASTRASSLKDESRIENVLLMCLLELVRKIYTTSNINIEYKTILIDKWTLHWRCSIQFA